MKATQLLAPLLSTKLYIPSRQSLFQQTTLVPRPHLLRKLEEGRAGKLMLIAAPAGFGKSTLLSEWIGEAEVASGIEQPSPMSAVASSLGNKPPQEVEKSLRRPAFCWFSIEAGDNDPVRFWVYFIAALQSLNPDFSPDTPILLQSPEPPPLETILTILLNDLESWSHTQSSEIVLVLEDYHVISAPEIHQSLTFLVDHLPPTLHLVMTTRADPPLPLARLRASGQLAEIRADDLRFTPDETALFLNEHMGLSLSSDEIHILAIHTEGWIAGLHLAALSMRGHDNKSDFLRSFSGSHRYILNYLIEEVLNQQPKAIQTFLLRTSILTRLCGSLCDAIMMDIEEHGDAYREEATQDPLTGYNSQAMLEQLVQANLFLVSLDEQGQWYRYHQLFAEVLQHRLRQIQPELLLSLHRKASQWYAQENNFTDAIQHALLAPDFVRAAALIERVWPALWNRGAIATLFNWMQTLPLDRLPEDSLPENALWGHPNLYVSYAWGLALAGQIEAAEAILHQIETTIQPIAPETGAAPTINILLGRTGSLHAMLAARRGGPNEAISIAKHALAQFPNDAPQRGDAYYALGLARQQQGDLAEALQAYEAATTLGRAADDNFLSVAARYHEARILMTQGNLQKAATAYQQLLAVAAQSGKQLPVVGLAHIGYGEILYQWNDLIKAVHEVDTGMALSPRRDLAYTDGPLHRFSILARIRQAMGDRAGALAAVALAQEAAQQTGIVLDVERVAALEALIHLRLGEPAVAYQWAEQYAQTQTNEEHFTYLHEFEMLVYVRTLIAQQHLDEALELLGKWLPILEASQRHGSLIELTILHALALRFHEQPDQAMSTLARVLMLTESTGYVRLFVDEGKPMECLLAEFKLWTVTQVHAEQQLPKSGYIDRLLAAFSMQYAVEDVESRAIQSIIPPPSSPIPRLIEPLTNRELEVLRLIAAGLSNAAIAEELLISVGTVKTHLKHIYGKLDVESRTQAALQARILNLL